MSRTGSRPPASTGSGGCGTMSASRITPCRCARTAADLNRAGSADVLETGAHRSVGYRSVRYSASEVCSVAIPDTAPAAPDRGDTQGEQGWHFSSTLVLALLLPLLFGLQGPIRRMLSAPVMQSWTTVFVAVLVQALPFLVLGVALSAAIAVFVPASFFARALPKRPALAVPVAGMAGAGVPGCGGAAGAGARGLGRPGGPPAPGPGLLPSPP